MKRMLATALGCAIATLLVACAGDGPAPDTSTAWFAVLQRDIFDQNCTSGPCHNPQAVAGGLVLTQGFSYDNLVGVEPENAAALSDGLLRVTAFDPDSSFLLRKLLAPGPGEGSRMPQGAAPLSAADIQFIRDWILAGAPGPQTPSATTPTPTPTATEIPATATATTAPTTAEPTATAPPDTPSATQTTPSQATATPTDPPPTDTPPPTDRPPPTEPTQVTLQQVQDAVFSPRCAVQFCHSGDFPAATLSLEEGKSFDELVNVTPATVAAADAGLLLVEPGNPDDSFLYIKIIGPPSPAFGSRMPQTGGFLDEDETALVRNWILTLEP